MAEEVKDAYEKLSATFKTGKTKTLEWRKKMINQVIKGLEEMGDEFGEAVQEDLRREPFVTTLFECKTTQENARHDLLHVEEYMADIKSKTEMLLMPGDTVIRYEPLGVCAVIGSWNFPVSTTIKPMLQAITAGNCCLLKPSEVSPNTSKVVKKFCDRFMTEEGEEAIICVEGGIEVGMAVNSLNLDLICFTGSTQIGRIIATTAAKNLTPCVLELGGKCPVVIDEGADLNFTASTMAFVKTVGCGQMCISADYVFVHSSLIDEFLERVEQKFKDMFGENPEESPDLSRIINDFHTDRLERLIKTAGGTRLYGGTVNKEDRYVAPTIIREPDKDSEMMQDEIFGPILPVYPYDDISEAINFINTKEKPLTVHYFGKRGHDNETRLANETSSGHFLTNCTSGQFLSNYQGFGGVGMSGYGRHGGRAGFESFSNRKGMLLKKPAPEFAVKMQHPPYSDADKNKLGKGMKGGLTRNQDQIASFCSGLCVSIVNIVLFYFFYMYAFANPDEGSCFTNKKGTIVVASMADTKTVPGTFVEVSQQFETWFLWGFILTCSTLAYYILSYINYKCGHGKLVAEFITLLGYFSVLGNLVWLVLGTLLRWTESANACSGDLGVDNYGQQIASGQAPYQWKSGKFMKVYLIVLYVVFGLSFLCIVGSSISESCSASIRRSHAHVEQAAHGELNKPLLN